MGMYTAMVFRAKLKQTNTDVIAALQSIYAGQDDRWDLWRELMPSDAPDRVRSGFIPKGGSAYCEDERAWLLKANGWTEGLQSGFWTCSCELKNYEGEIQWFLANVLPGWIMDRVKVFTAYEEQLYGDWGIGGWDFEVVEPMQAGARLIEGGKTA